MLAFQSCEEQTTEPTPMLESFGIIGEWSFESRVVNGISNLAAPCCATLEFRDDATTDDFFGEFISNDSGSETTGTFQLMLLMERITFSFNDRQLVYDYRIEDDRLTFDYLEDEDEVSETWARKN